MSPTLAAGGRNVDAGNSVIVVGNAHPEATDAVAGCAAAVVAQDRLPLVGLLPAPGGLPRCLAMAGGGWEGDHGWF